MPAKGKAVNILIISQTSQNGIKQSAQITMARLVVTTFYIKLTILTEAAQIIRLFRLKHRIAINHWLTLKQEQLFKDMI